MTTQNVTEVKKFPFVLKHISWVCFFLFYTDDVSAGLGHVYMVYFNQGFPMSDFSSDSVLT